MCNVQESILIKYMYVLKGLTIESKGTRLKTVVLVLCYGPYLLVSAIQASLVTIRTTDN